MSKTFEIAYSPNTESVQLQEGNNVESVIDRAIAREISLLQDLNKEKYLSKMVPFLVNKDGFEMLVEKRLSDYKGSFVIMFLDGDKFKSVNDTYGHGFGDEAIKAMGKAIAASSRTNIRESGVEGVDNIIPRDVLGHVGGDEFCVLLLPYEGQVWNRVQADMAAHAYESRISKMLTQGFTAKDKNNKIVTIKLGMTGGAFIGDTEDGVLDVKGMTKIADANLEEKKQEKKRQGKSWLQNKLNKFMLDVLKKQGLR